MLNEPTLPAAPAHLLAGHGEYPLPEIAPLRNAAEAALAVIAAFAAMLTVATVGLSLMGAGSVTSVGAAAAAVVSLAVGGSPGGLLSVGIVGSLRFMPLGVTLAGTAALGLAFYLPLRRWRRLTPRQLAGRVAAAAATSCLALAAVAAAGQGTVRLPSPLAGRLSGLGGQASPLGRLGPLGGILRGVLGDVIQSLVGNVSVVSFRVGAAGTVLSGLVWLLAVLAAGLLVARPGTLPAKVAWSRPRAAVSPALSASVQVVLVLVIAFAAFGVNAGLAVGHGDGPGVTGAVLLLLPGLLLAVLSAGAAVPWSLSAGPAASPGGGPGGAGMLGNLVGGSAPVTSVQRSHSLPALVTTGNLLWVPLLLGTAAVLLACGVLAAVRTPPLTEGEGTPARIRRRRAGRQAAALGAVWAAGLSVLVLCGGLSGRADLSAMGMSMMSFGAHADANAVLAFFAGFAGGGAAGGAGSLLVDKFRRLRQDPP